MEPAAATARRTVSRLLLPALTIAFGLQLLRVLLPLIVYVLRERIGWSAPLLGELAVALFATSFLAALARLLLGRRWFLVVSVGGVGLVRLAVQVWDWDPVGDLVLAVLGTVLLGWSLPALLASARAAGRRAVEGLGLSLLLGVTLDAALHGALSTYDLAWRSGFWPLVAAVVLAAVHWVALGSVMRESERSAAGPSHEGVDLPGLPALGLLALGPWLALELLVLENGARLATFTGWSAAYAGTWVTLGAAAAVAAAALVPRRPVAGGAGVALVAGLILIVTLLPGDPRGWPAALLVLAGHAALGVLFAVLFQGLAGGVGRPGLWRTSVGFGGGMVLFVLLLFLTYAGYDIALPFAPEVLPPVAAVLIAVAVLPAARVTGARALRVAAPPGVRGAVIAAFAAVGPALLVGLVQQVPSLRPALETGGVRVMTYNIHNGFGASGDLDLEALARTIEEQGADVVALQEVARGWVIDSSADELDWLSRRLDMQAVFGPTAGPFWGNAVLSRLPIIDAASLPLPTQDLVLQRGLLLVSLNSGDGRELQVIATHYHHVDDGTAVRVEESAALLRAWQGAERSVVMGDFNARPGDPEIEMLREAGLVEVLAASGVSPGYTYSSDRPYERIDYIWVSPDLAGSGGAGLSDAQITEGRASDHLGVAATITP